MRSMARGKVPGNTKKAPRAAASHLAGDLDRQARLTVEGRGHDGHTSDIETVLCTWWAAAMGQKGAWL
jgi:hypothetical protein